MSLAERAACALLYYFPLLNSLTVVSGILMDRIVPPTFDTLFLRDGQVLRVRAVSELGIYSVFIGYIAFA